MKALKNLEVWRRSCRLSVDLYRTLDKCKERAFKDQVTRSALSVPSNIAEGYERDSTRETIRFLKIAKGSCGELWTQIHIGMEAGFIEKSVGASFSQETETISKMLQGLIRYYQESEGS